MTKAVLCTDMHDFRLRGPEPRHAGEFPVAADDKNIGATAAWLTVGSHGGPVGKHRTLAVTNRTVTMQLHAGHEALCGFDVRQQIRHAVEQTVSIAELEIR